MKRGLLVFAIMSAIVFSACGSVSSITSGSVSYPAPVAAGDSETFTGSGLDYSTARAKAIKDAAAKGYTQIVAEVIERSQVTGFVDVTVVMLK